MATACAATGCATPAAGIATRAGSIIATASPSVAVVHPADPRRAVIVPLLPSVLAVRVGGEGGGGSAGRPVKARDADLGVRHAVEDEQPAVDLLDRGGEHDVADGPDDLVLRLGGQ